jgi:hypothetical protein
MPVLFEEFTLRHAERIIKDRYNADADKAIAFYNGDHWQKGDAWIGPVVQPESKLHKPTLEVIERTFISHNAIGETTDRHVSGVLSKELHWKFVVDRDLGQVPKLDPVSGQPMTDEVTGEPIMVDGEPTDAESALISEAEAILVRWWNDRNILETLKRAVAGMLNVGRAPLRIVIPPGLRDEQGNLPPVVLEVATDLIYLDHMGFDEETQKQVLPTATIHIDKNTRQPIGIFTYKEIKEDADGVEAEGEERAELTFLDDAQDTVLRVINGDGNIGEPVTMPLGKRILMYEMQRKPMINPQIMSQQRSLNKTLTMKDRNDTQGGFLERYFLNMKWPTTTIKNADGSTEDVPEPLYTGPSTVNSLQGSTVVDDAGQTHVLNPSVQFRDPVSPATFIDSAEYTYLGILKGTNQLHYANVSESLVSGDSRKQGRHSYTVDLQATGNVVEGAARWTLETVLALASFLSGQAGRFEGLRAFVQAKIDAGPVEPDDMRVAADMMDRGVWDWETAASATGVDDVDALKQRLDEERRESEQRQQAFMDKQKSQANSQVSQNATEQANNTANQAIGDLANRFNGNQ